MNTDESAAVQNATEKLREINAQMRALNGHACADEACPMDTHAECLRRAVRNEVATVMVEATLFAMLVGAVALAVRSVMNDPTPIVSPFGGFGVPR